MKNLKQIIILFLITSLTVPVFADSESEITILFQNGLDAVKEGNIDDALSYFDQVLELDPDNLNALANKAGMLIQIQKFDEADSVLDKALMLDSSHKGALNNKALVLYYQGKLEESVTYFDKILEIDPNNIFALTMKSTILIDMERIDQADELLNKVLSINPDYPLALSLKSDIHIKKGEKSEAFQYLKKLAETQPLLLNKLDKSILGLIWSDALGLVEIKITDSNGNLVGFLQTKKIRILEHDITDMLFEKWEHGGERIIDGIKYEVLHEETNSQIFKSSLAGRSGYGLSVQSDDFSEGSNHNIWALIAIHPQYVVKEGDHITTSYTILRPVS